MINRLVDVNRSSHPNADRGRIGVLGVDWSENDLGELESLAQLLQTLPNTVRRLEYSHCLGRSQEVTPVNVYRRMRMRVRQMENTMQLFGAMLEAIKVRFYVTRRGAQATVETLECSTTVNRGFSPRLQEHLRRNRLIHQAKALAEPDREEATTTAAENNDDGHQLAPSAKESHHHALWGRALVRLLEIRDLDVSASALFTLLQQCPDYVQPRSP